jgi:deoxyribonuclease-4
MVRAARRARSLGCECIQVFARNARGWRGRTYSQAETAEFRSIVGRADISPIVVHSCYLVNLASPDRALRERSLRSVADDMVRAVALGGTTVVTHFGHHTGAGTNAGLRTLAQSIRSLLARAPDGVQLLLENTAGRGSEMGSTWAEFVRLLDLLHGDERVAVCFDTCHAHAAGHRLDTARWVGRTLREFDRALGLPRLRLIHLNDCRAPASSHIDHHQHIGRGTIGDVGFRAFLRRRKIRDRSAILETPIERPGDDRRNLRRARLLRDRR